ncbi:MAG: DUF3467 domain-containing protein [Anaerolineae bacterium]|nr:DUF3467 domain-containing protein [Anaerolineae bacterium]
MQPPKTPPPAGNSPHQASQQTGLQIDIPANLDATYSNFAVIQHTPAEFVIDFVRVLPNMPHAKVGARVVTTPMHAKLLLRALQDNIDKYEAQYGTIYTPQQGGEQLVTKLFGG